MSKRNQFHPSNIQRDVAYQRIVFFRLYEMVNSPLTLTAGTEVVNVDTPAFLAMEDTWTACAVSACLVLAAHTLEDIATPTGVHQLFTRPRRVGWHPDESMFRYHWPLAG